MFRKLVSGGRGVWGLTAREECRRWGWKERLGSKIDCSEFRIFFTEEIRRIFEGDSNEICGSNSEGREWKLEWPEAGRLLQKFRWVGMGNQSTVAAMDRRRKCRNISKVDLPGFDHVTRKGKSEICFVVLGLRGHVVVWKMTRFFDTSPIDSWGPIPSPMNLELALVTHL